MPWRSYRTDRGLEIYSVDVGPLHATIVDSSDDVIWSIDVGSYHTAYVAARSILDAKKACLAAMRQRARGYIEVIDGLEAEL